MRVIPDELLFTHSNVFESYGIRVCRDLEMSANAQCLLRSAQPGDCQYCSIKGLALYPSVCSGSQQTLDLLVLGKPAAQNSSVSSIEEPGLVC